MFNTKESLYCSFATFALSIEQCHRHRPTNYIKNLHLVSSGTQRHTTLQRRFLQVYNRPHSLTFDLAHLFQMFLSATHALKSRLNSFCFRPTPPSTNVKDDLYISPFHCHARCRDPSVLCCILAYVYLDPTASTPHVSTVAL